MFWVPREVAEKMAEAVAEAWDGKKLNRNRRRNITDIAVR